MKKRFSPSIVAQPTSEPTLSLRQRKIPELVALSSFDDRWLVNFYRRRVQGDLVFCAAIEETAVGGKCTLYDVLYCDKPERLFEEVKKLTSYDFLEASDVEDFLFPEVS